MAAYRIAAQIALLAEAEEINGSPTTDYSSKAEDGVAETMFSSDSDEGNSTFSKSTRASTTSLATLCNSGQLRHVIELSVFLHFSVVCRSYGVHREKQLSEEKR